MKTRLLQLLSLAGFVLLSSASMAQSGGKKFSFGLKVGANFSQLDDLSYHTPRLDMNGRDGGPVPMMSGGKIVYDFFRQNDSRTTGIVGGLYARFGNRIYLQPEILFSVKGGKFDIIKQGLETQSVNVKIGTIDLPLLLGIRLGPFRLNAGPMASLTVLDGNLKGALNQYGSQPISETAKQARFGYQAGIGLTLAGMQLDLRREGGLYNLREAPADALGTPSTTRSNLWQLTVGFGF